MRNSQIANPRPETYFLGTEITQSGFLGTLVWLIEGFSNLQALRTDE